MDYTCDILKQFDERWALVTAGHKESFNAMTISWGALGTIWGRDALTIYIRPERYTCKFLKEAEYFTVSFYDESYKKQLGYMGSHSGKDTNKIEDIGFHPVFISDDKITYQEAQETFVLKKIYMQQMDKSLMDEKALSFYGNDGQPHYMIIGQIVDIIKL